MFKKIVSVFILCILIFSTSINSMGQEEFYASVSVNQEEGSINVSGAGRGKIVISVIPADKKFGEITDENGPLFVDMIIADGSFSNQIGLPPWTENGKYKYLITSENGSFEGLFIYFDAEAADVIVENINDVTSAEAVKTILLNNASEIGIEKDKVFEDNIEFFAEMIQTKEYEDSVDFYNTYSRIYPLAQIYGSEHLAIKNILMQFQNELGINYENDVANNNNLTTNAFNRLCELLSETEFKDVIDLKDENSFKSLFDEYKVLAALQTAKNWVTVKEIITEQYPDVFAEILDGKKYQQIDEKDLVFEKMMHGDFSSLDKAVDSLDGYVKSVYKKENTSSVSSSGGSTGGIGGGGTTIITEVKKEEIIQSAEINDVSFLDISKDFWGYDAIYTLAKKDILSGYEDNSFKPSNAITRAEFAKLVSGFIKENSEAAEEAIFIDVSENDWFYECVTKAAKSGIVKGSEGMFSPGDKIKREDAALIIYRILVANGESLNGMKPFADRNEISDYAKSAVGALGLQGIITGTGDNKFQPLATITRAQAAQLIYNAFVNR